MVRHSDKLTYLLPTILSWMPDRQTIWVNLKCHCKEITLIAKCSGLGAGQANIQAKGIVHIT